MTAGRWTWRRLAVALGVIAAAATIGPTVAASALRNVGSGIATRAAFTGGDASAALPWFTGAAAIGGSSRDRTWAARLQWALGDRAGAEATMGTPADTDGWLLAAAVAEARGDRAAAIAAWRRVPAVSERFAREADQAARDGRLAEAEALWERARQIAPESASVARRHGLFLLGPRGDPARAAMVLAEAIALGAGQDNPYTYVEYAHALHQLGRVAEANAVLTAHPVDAALANAIRADAARQAGDLATAQRLLERSRAQEPNDPWTLHALASVLAAQGRRDAARAVWQDALRVAPGFAPALSGLASLEATP